MLKRISLYLLQALLLTCLLPNSTLAQSEKKIAFSVLLDNSRSLEKQFPQVLTLGKGVITRIHKRGPVSLFNFIWKRDEGAFVIRYVEDVREGGSYDVAVASLGVEWSQNEEDLGHYIDDILVVKGNTDLLGAIHLMAEALNTKANAEKDTFVDKVIILVTDGEHRIDETGRSTYKDDEIKKRANQLIKELKENRIKVYAVGLVEELNAYGGSIYRMAAKEKAMWFLEKITKGTDGRIVFPKSKKFDVDKVLDKLLAQ